MAEAAKFQKMFRVMLFVVACLLVRTDARLSEDVGFQKCNLSPPWSARIVKNDSSWYEDMYDPVLDNRGHVVVVVLTAASSGLSLNQAQKLHFLQSYFHGIGMTDVTFVLLNHAESQGNVTELIALDTSLIIAQDLHEKLAWKKLAGKKDDVFIYDRCGRLTYKIPFPLSLIHPRQQLVESAVISTYLDDLCGNQSCIKNESVGADSAETENLNTTHNVLIDVATVLNDSQADYDIYKEDQHHRSDQNENINHPTPTPTPPNNGVWSFFQRMWHKIPWAEKDDRLKNAVPKDNSTPQMQVQPAATPATLCSSANKHTCMAWTQKKIQHAQACCRAYEQHQSNQHLLKHCKHYTKTRCQKVEVILRCCPNDVEDTRKTETSVESSASSAKS